MMMSFLYVSFLLVTLPTLPCPTAFTAKLGQS